jgi:fibronectin-binding autotransporter adhesin
MSLLTHYFTVIRSVLRVLSLSIILLSTFSSTWGQKNGDFRSRGNSNWTANNAWQKFVANTWQNTSEYPGQNPAEVGAKVTILAGHTITLNAILTNPIDSIQILGTLASGNFTLNIIRAIHNDGTINLGSGTIQFTGTTLSKTISGNGTFNFYNLTLNSGTNVNVTATSNLNISNSLNFSSNGILIVGAESNIILSNTASIQGANANRYIQLDGTNGNNSQLIKNTNNSVTPWQMTYPIGSPIGGYTPITLSAGVTNPSNNARIAVKSIYNESIPGASRRTFRITSLNNNNNTTYTASFSYNNSTDLSFGDDESNYTKIWILNPITSTWSSTDRSPTTSPFTVTGLNLNSGGTTSSRTTYITIGNPTAYPNVWYSYQSGNWSDWENWTLDPSGTTLVNGLNTIPGAGDDVMILNGVTITSNINNISISNITIQGGATLDMAESSNATFGNVKGSGVLKIKGINFPSGNYTDFVATTGGTIEFYHTVAGTYQLPQSQTTFNNLILSNTSNANIIFTTANNFTVNNNFSINQYAGNGSVEWRINNGTANQRTITLLGNLTISNGGKISCSNSGQTSQHQINLYGNLTNYGEVKFFQVDDAQLSVTQYNNNSVYTLAQKTNAATVRFVGTNNQRVDCFNTTDFYKIVLDKGIGQQAKLTINSSALNNFRLFGPTNLARTGTAPQVISPNALSLINGTLELQGTLHIKSLSQDVGSSYAIPQNAAIWLNGDGVRINNSVSAATQDNEHIDFYGTVRVTAGEFNIYSRGLLAGFSALVFVEGGTLNLWKFRTTQTGGAINSVTFNQTGGVVNIGTPGMTGSTGNLNNYPRFALPYNTCSFSMSGGVLNVGQPTVDGPSVNTGILIASDLDKVNVTGGTVNIILPASATNFIINSSAPFYNMNIRKVGAGTSSAQLGDVVFNDGANKTEPARPLRIINNLTLETGSTPSFLLNNNNLSIGGNFTISSSTTFNPGTSSTILFDGNQDQLWNNNGTITNLGNVTIDKKNSVLTLGGSASFPSIEGTQSGLTINSGSFNDGTKSITVTRSITNNAIHLGSGSLIIGGNIAQVGGTGIYGNLTFNTTSSQVELSGRNEIRGNLRLISNTKVYVGKYNLTVLGEIFSNTGNQKSFDANKFILFNGYPEAGGLTLQSKDNIDLIFPIGSLSIGYTPATILVDVDNTSGTSGLINVIPVSSIHPNVTSNNAVNYYWKVTSEGFSGINTVTHKTYTYNTAVRNASGNTYRAARFDASIFTWSYSNVTYNSNTSPGTTTIATNNPSANAFNTGINWTNISGSQLDGEYTAGLADAFGNVQVFYSRVNGNWSNASTWSNTPCSGAGACGSASTGIPTSNSIVVIGDENNAHTVTIDANNQSCGKLQINTTSTLDCRTYTGLNFGAAIGTSEGVTGRGTLRIGSANFPAGDFTNFLGPEGGTVEWYGTYTIPSVGPSPQFLKLNSYYNLIVSTSGGNITLPDEHLTIYNKLIKNGNNTLFTNMGGTRNIVTKSTFINQGSLRFNSVITNLTILDTLFIATNGLINVVGSTSVQHSLTVKGNTVNDGTLGLRNGAHIVKIIFEGEQEQYFSGNGVTELATLTLNKGNSQQHALNISLSNTLTTPSNNWLFLENGTLHLNTNSNILFTNNTPFFIPNTCKVKISSGIIDMIGSTNVQANDVQLAGCIEVIGGVLSINSNPTHNSNNDIEYAAAGNPTIIVSGGELYVNGAIRRPLTTLGGSLNYIQTGGIVTIGGRGTSGNNTRGVFEIENNPGSNFTMTGGTLHIRRSSGVTSFGDVYINPQTYNTNDQGTIQMGMETNTPNVTSTLSINTGIPIGNLKIFNASVSQNVNINSSPLTLKGGLTIEANSTLTTKGFDVTIGGDLTIDGTYTGGTIGNYNTTIFNGVGNQTATLSNSSTFNNLTIDKQTGSVALYGSSPIITDLNIFNGTLDVRDLQLSVIGNITNRAAQISSTSTGAIVLSGTTNTHIIASDNGSFHNLTFGGTVNKTAELNGNTTITGTLNFNTGSYNRIFFIGGNQLTFGETATVLNAANTNTESKFIKTNGVSSDLGVTKIWPSTGTNSFTYAVGSRTTYSPVSMTLTTSSSGSLTVIPVSEQHPTSSAETQLLLNYYWILKRSNNLTIANNGTHTYQFPTALFSGSGGSPRGAHLDAINLIGWTQPIGNLSTSGNNTLLTITNNLTTNFPPVNGEFHYTVGTELTLPNPITPVYSRIANVGNTEVTQVGNLNTGGNWNLATNWTLSPTGIGAGLATVPVGRPVVILPNHRMNMNIPGLRAFRTEINGILYTSTTGHNLGTITGTGTLRTTTNILPAGSYVSFVSSTGGTIEFDFTGTNTISNRDTYNNLSIRSGIAQMTNVNLTINGNVTILSGATLDNSINNRNISIRNHWENSGTFNSGSGTVTFNGNSNQSISGSTSFYDLTINKPGGQLLLSNNGTTTVQHNLTLTHGHVVTTNNHVLSLPLNATILGGTSESFIVGPLRKVIGSNSSFISPAGSLVNGNYRPVTISNTTAQDTWTMEYVGQNPNDASYDISAMGGGLGTVSRFEYWNVSRVGSASATLSLSYGPGSYVGNNVGVLENLRLARWNGSEWNLPPGGGEHSQTGSYTQGTVTATNITNFSPFTLASIDINSPLPVTWISFKGQVVGSNAELVWRVGDEKNNQYFEVERSTNGIDFHPIGKVNSHGNQATIQEYVFTDVGIIPLQRFYYRIRQVDWDGKSDVSNVIMLIQTKESDGERWAVYPNPLNSNDNIIIKDLVGRSDDTIEAQISNTTGKIIFSGKGDVQTLSNLISQLDIAPGVYLLILKDLEYAVTYRIVKL